MVTAREDRGVSRRPEPGEGGAPPIAQGPIRCGGPEVGTRGRPRDRPARARHRTDPRARTSDSEVLAVGVIVQGPLSRVPENTLKFAVGLLLSSFGTFWAAEGAGVDWPGSDLAILGILAVLIVVSVAYVQALRRRRAVALRTAA